MDEALTDEETRSLRAATEIPVGYPLLEIIRHAKTHDVDRIVLGTHGRGAIEHICRGAFVTASRWWICGLEMLALGALVAAVAYATGAGIASVIQ